MRNFYSSLFVRPWTTSMLLSSSLVISILGLAPSFFVILTLNKFLTSTVISTLVSLIILASLCILFEFTFRQNRDRMIKNFSHNETHNLLEKTKEIANKNNGLPQQIGQSYRFIEQTNSNASLYSSVLDFPFMFGFLTILYFLSPKLTYILLAILLLVWFLYTIKPVTKLSENTMLNVDIALMGILIVSTIGYGAVLVTQGGSLDVGTLIGFNILGARCYQSLSKVMKSKNVVDHRYKAIIDLHRFNSSKIEPTIKT